MTTLYNTTSYTITLDFFDMFQDYFSIYHADTHSSCRHYYTDS